MQPVHGAQFAFSDGERSPLMEGSALGRGQPSTNARQIENMHVSAHGGVARRRGTELTSSGYSVDRIFRLGGSLLVFVTMPDRSHSSDSLVPLEDTTDGGDGVPDTVYFGSVDFSEGQAYDCECRYADGTGTLVGFSEYVASTPPQKYLTKEHQGALTAPNYTRTGSPGSYVYTIATLRFQKAGQGHSGWLPVAYSDGGGSVTGRIQFNFAEPPSIGGTNINFGVEFILDSYSGSPPSLHVSTVGGSMGLWGLSVGSGWIGVSQTNGGNCSYAGGSLGAYDITFTVLHLPSTVATTWSYAGEAFYDHPLIDQLTVTGATTYDPVTHAITAGGSASGTGYRIYTNQYGPYGVWEPSTSYTGLTSVDYFPSSTHYAGGFGTASNTATTHTLTSSGAYFYYIQSQMVADWHLLTAVSMSDSLTDQDTEEDALERARAGLTYGAWDMVEPFEAYMIPRTSGFNVSFREVEWRVVLTGLSPGDSYWATATYSRKAYAAAGDHAFLSRDVASGVASASGTLTLTGRVPNASGMRTIVAPTVIVRSNNPGSL